MKVILVVGVSLSILSLGNGFRIPREFIQTLRDINNALEHHERQAEGSTALANPGILGAFGAVFAASLATNLLLTSRDAEGRILKLF